jgi:hypothetical protein
MSLLTSNAIQTLDVLNDKNKKKQKIIVFITFNSLQFISPNGFKFK